jgi:uncharacterized protein (DUF58 family)
VARRPLRTVPIVGAVVRQYEERLTSRGRYLLWAAAVFAFLGADTRRTQVFVLFAVAAAALALAFAVALSSRSPRLQLRCGLPRRATARVPLRLTARVSGASRVAHDLLLHFPRPLKWGSSIRYGPKESFLLARPGETTELAVEFEALRRGKYELRGPTLRRSDPLRLATGGKLALSDQALLVYPRFFHLDEFEIPLGRRYQPGGIPLSSSTGDAIEFVGTREYREGDPLRHIHWRSWARRGEPVVKEYQEEYFCRIAIILDTFLPRKPAPLETEAFEAAISVVASIADYFSRSEYIVDILAAGPDVYEVSAGRSLAYLENILDVMACLEPCHEPAFESIGPHLFDKLAQITTVVAVLQDWDPRRADFLRRVKALGTAVRAVVVRPGETTLDWRSADPELGEVGLMTPADVERAIAATVAEAEPRPSPGGGGRG